MNGLGSVAERLPSTLGDLPAWSGVIAAGTLTAAALAATFVVPWAGPVALLALSTVVMLSVMAQRDAVTALSFLVILVFGLSSRLVLGPLGAVGQPATVLGIALMWLWVHGRIVPTLGLATGRNPVRQALLVFGWAMGLAYAVAQSQPLRPVVASSSDRAIVNLVALLGVALLTVDGVATRERLESLLRRAVAGGVFLATVGIVQFSTGYDLPSRIRVPGLRLNGDLETIAQRSMFRRVAGTAVHGIEFGVVIALLLPIAIHFAVHAPPGRRAARWVAVLVLGAALPMAVSRSTAVAVGVGFFVLFLGWTWGQRVRASVAIVVFLAVMRAVVPGLLGTIRSLFLHWNDDPSISGRTNDYEIVSRWLAESPWFGRGLGTLVPTETLFLDNQFLGSLVEGGWVGLAATVAPFGVAIAVLLRLRRRPGISEETRHLCLAIVAALVVEVSSWMSFDALGFRMNAIVSFMLLGCAGAMWRITSQGSALEAA